MNAPPDGSSGEPAEESTERDEHELYKEHILDLYKHPLNYGKMDGATHMLEERNPLCGDVTTVFLVVKDNIIVDARFVGKGCAISMASASLVTNAVRGKRVEDVLSMGVRDVTELLMIPVGPVRMKCALLPLRTIQKALDDTGSAGVSEKKKQGEKEKEKKIVKDTAPEKDKVI